VQKLAPFVLDKREKPLMPCSGRRTRLLLERSRAVIHRRYPFASRIKDRVGGAVQPVRIKVEPGSRHTGIGVTREENGHAAIAVARFSARLLHARQGLFGLPGGR
jgi:hypothetical protein